MPGEVVSVPSLVVLVNVLITLAIFVLVLRTVLASVLLFRGRDRFGPVLGTITDYLVDGTEPLLAPVRRLLPNVGLSLDFSPLVAIIVLDLIGRLLTFALLRVM